MLKRTTALNEYKLFGEDWAFEKEDKASLTGRIRLPTLARDGCIKWVQSLPVIIQELTKMMKSI